MLTKQIPRQWGAYLATPFVAHPTSHFRSCIYERPAMNGPEQVLNLMQ